MIVVDTHCHALPYWFEPIESLLDQMNRHGVAKAVLIQVSGMYDNSYLIECMRRFPGRFAVVVLVDTDQPDAPEDLDRWVKEGAQGIRLWADVRSPGPDPLAIWRKASDLGVPVSCPGSTDQFASAEFEDIVKELPNLNIIIEHLGHLGQDTIGTTPPMTKFRKVLGLARYGNTFMKVPGLGEICPRPMPFRHPNPFESIPPVIEMAVDAFGPSRLMWGSDYPPVSSREGYGNALRYPLENVAFRSDEDKEWVFGKTALTLWNFDVE